MTSRYWLPNLAPVTTLLIGVVFALSIVFAAIIYEKSMPSLGIELTGNAGFVVVEQVADGPLQGKMNVGDVILTIGVEDGAALSLTPDMLIEEPNSLLGYAALNDFLHRQQQVSDMMRNNAVQLTTGDSQQLTVQPLQDRPLVQIPSTFWLLVLFGFTVFVIGVAVWSFRRGQIHTRILAVGGFGLFIGAIAAAIYASREIALPQYDLLALIACNDMGIMLFAYSMVLLLWYYPTRLFAFPMARVVYILVIAVWFMQVMQSAEIVHSFYKYILAWALILTFGTYQWRRTRQSPLDRAALKWLVLTIAIMATLIAVSWYIPILYGSQPVASITTSFGLVFVLYIGLVLGVIRYKLFELERWWIDIWIWLASGLMVVSVDLLFFLMMEMAFIPSLAIAVLLIGWVYFPLRQKVLAWLRPDSNRRFEKYIPDMIGTLFDQERYPSSDEKLRALARDAFVPLGIKEIRSADSDIKIADSGLTLHIPMFEAGKMLELSSCGRGSRLFSDEDERMAKTLRGLVDRAVSLKAAQEAGASVERERIMRDLHDDVAARLLSLVHSVPTVQLEDQARSALYALRDTIYSLERNERIAFQEVLLSIRAYVDEAVAGYPLRLEWQDCGYCSEISLSSRQQINMQRVVQEAVANALKHASPSMLRIEVSLEETLCRLLVCHDGEFSSPDEWVAGQGLHNIKTRARELNGEAKWHVPDDGRCCMQLVFPVLRREVA